ncbi:MAG: PEP/pyruvate-binding domain-containing protein [Candidatus Margulisiibacteriota bacterium]
MDSGRVITSRIYGELGRFAAAGRPNLYRSPSGRVLVLGEGAVGGKGEGTLYLDKVADEMGFRVPGHSLVICDDYFGMPAIFMQKITDLDPGKVQRVQDILKEENFPGRLAIRSSSVIEDKPGRSAAGVFKTNIFEAQGNELINSLVWVLNGNCASLAKVFYRSIGIREIPPLPVIIQELIGNEFSYAPQCFFPALAGIVNTASPQKIKIATVPGFGTTAVQEGWGMLHEFDLEGVLIGKAEGEMPWIKVLKEGKEAQIGNLAGRIYSSAVNSAGQKISAVHARLVKLAAHFQERLGAPLDIEWAVSEEGAVEPYLLQIRQIHLKRKFPQPSILPSKVLFSTSAIVGQAVHSFSRVVVMDCALRADSDEIPSPSEEQLEKLGALYPDNIVLYFDNVQRSTIYRVAKLFPFTRAVVVSEEEYRANRSGPTGLEHIALRCIDEDKLLFYLNGEGGQLVTEFGAISRSKKMLDPEKMPGIQIDVYELAEPLTIAGSDEDGWGMIYRGGEPRLPRK